MKRIYACFAIVAALLATAFYSSFQVQRFADDISTDLDCAIEAIRTSDLPTARQALARGADRCDAGKDEPPAAHGGFYRAGSSPAHRRRAPGAERPRRSLWGTAPGTGTGGNTAMAGPAVCVNTKSTASLLLYRESGALQITGYCASFRSPMSFFSSLKKLSTSANCR